MRVLIASLLLLFALSAPAASDTLALKFRNSDGGDIIITNTPCEQADRWYAAKATNRDGKVVVTGCWTLFGSEVVVIYEDGDVYRYPMARFMP